MLENKTLISAVVAVAGIVIIIVSVLADTLGIGSGPEKFGTLQIIGTIVGVVVLLAGGAFYYMQQGGTAGEQP